MEHGKTGMLVAPENPEALADAIIEALQNPEIRVRMATYAREKVIDKFDWTKVAEKYAGLYIKHIRTN